MHTNKKLLLFKFLFVISVVCCADLPSSLKKCKRDDKLGECLKDAVQDALPELSKGLREFNFPSIEPLYLESLVIGEGTKGAVRVVQKFKDVNIHGISKAKVESVKATANDTELVLETDVLVENMNLIADYSLNGQVLVLPIVGDGKCDIKLINLRTKLTFICKTFEKNGETYIGVEDVKINLKPDKVEFTFDNLFGGDKQLSAQILKLLNDNWTEVFEDIRPGYEEAMAIICKSITNLIFKKVPYKMLMPPK